MNNVVKHIEWYVGEVMGNIEYLSQSVRFLHLRGMIRKF